MWDGSKFTCTCNGAVTAQPNSFHLQPTGHELFLGNENSSCPNPSITVKLHHSAHTRVMEKDEMKNKIDSPMRPGKLILFFV